MITVQIRSRVQATELLKAVERKWRISVQSRHILLEQPITREVQNDDLQMHGTLHITRNAEL